MPAAPRSSPLAFHQLVTVAILVTGAIASVISYRLGRRDEYERAEAQFARRSTTQYALSREVLRRYEDALFGLSLTFTVDTSVTRAEFVRAASQVEQRLAGAHALEWVPLTTHENRAALEAAMQRSVRPDFQIVQFDAAGKPVRAADRPVYYPICYIHPLAGNELASGYDLKTGPSLAYLERARETRQLLVTHPLRLVQESAERLGIVMIHPVYRVQRAPHENPGHDGTPVTGGHTSPPEEFIGFLQCVFRLHDLLEQARSAQPDAVLDMLFVDATEVDPTKRILYYRPASDAAPRTPVPSEAEFRTGLHRVHELNIGQRTWRIYHRPRADWLESQRSTTPFLRASTIMLVAAMLAGLVRILARQTITIQRQVEERTAELAESRRQFATLLHALPGMAFRCSYDQQMTVLFVSEGAQVLTGWTAEDFMSGRMHFRALIHPDDLPRVREVTREAVKRQQDIEIEYRIRARDGTEKWVLSRSRGLVDAQRRYLVEGLAIDITAQKNSEAARLGLERKLLEGQKLESLGLLAGGIAHDFNNLLSTILGNASMARMALSPESPSDKQLRAIENASLRAAELCRQMLAYAGKGRFVVEATDVTTLTEDILPLLRISLARQAKLELNLTKGLPVVMSDATQLRQIVMNLVLNAADAIGLGGQRGTGEIKISTGLARVHSDELASYVTGTDLAPGEYVYLQVRDNGCGMTPEVLAKIFDPFFTTKFAGRGLGLAAVLGIVRAHRGALQVTSKPGEGSTFRLLLPPAHNAPAPAIRPDARSGAPWRHHGTVLVIEDEEHVRTMTVEVLKTFGFKVQDAANGTEGISRFRENPTGIDLVVLDVLMPGLNGEQTLAALRNLRPDIRVLLISGYHESDLLDRVAGQGPVTFLAKPFTRDAFERKLRELLG